MLRRRKLSATIAILLSLFFGNLPYALAAETVEYTWSGIGPESSAVTPDGSAVWVINYNASTLLKYSTSSHSLLATIGLGGSAFEMVMLPDASKIYVCLNSSTTVAVVNTSTATKTGTVTLAGNCASLGATSDSAYVYVTYGSNSISKIQTSTDTISSSGSISGASSIYDVKVSPDSQYLYVAVTGSVYKLNASDYSTAAFRNSIQAKFIALSPDGTIIYSSGYQTTSSIYKITTSTMALAATITGLNNPAQSSFSPDGQYIYVGNASASTIVKYRVSDNSIVSTISGMQATAWHNSIDRTGTYLYVSANGTSSYFYQINLGMPATITLTLSPAVYRTSTSLQAVLSYSGGVVTFFQNGKYIPGCQKINAASTTVTCNYKPTIHGAIQITAKYVANGSTVTSSGTLRVSKRSNTR
jgi:DNA-binding beta-propeller fold protein YncE